MNWIERHGGLPEDYQAVRDAIVSKEKAHQAGYDEGTKDNAELAFLRKVAELINESRHKEEIIKHLLDEDHKPNLSGDTVEVWISKNGRIYFGAGTEDLDSIICRHVRAGIECHWINDHKGE